MSDTKIARPFGRLPSSRAAAHRIIVIAIAVVSALVSFIVVSWLAPPSTDGPAVARSALEAARAADGGDIHGSVAGTLPEGTRAWIGMPAAQGTGGNDPQPLVPARGDQVVTVISSGPDRATRIAEISQSLAVATAIDPQGGWWTAVTVPSAGSTLPASLAAALVAGSAVLAVSAAGARVPRRGPTRSGPAIAPAVGTALTATQRPAPDTGSPPKLLADQRTALVRGLVDLMPQLPDGLAWQATNTLATAGVSVVVPDGERFDPNDHHVVDTRATSDTRLVDTVARTVRPGYADGDCVVVYPKVVVYTAEPGSPGVSP